MHLINLVVEKTKLGENLIIHCEGGIGRTGTFIANVLIQEYLNNEGLINNVNNINFDVFKFLMSLRTRRPGMIESKEQFASLFKLFESLE